MQKINDLRYTFIGLAIAAAIGCLISLFTELSFWAAFVMAAMAMFVNGIIAEYEDNLPGGFNNPMSPEEIKAENAKRRKNLFPLRAAIWLVFSMLVLGFVWAYIRSTV